MNAKRSIVLRARAARLIARADAIVDAGPPTNRSAAIVADLVLRADRATRNAARAASNGR